MNAFLTYALFTAGVIILVKCGDLFVDGASYFARVTGVPQIIVGATVVSFGTTLPEIIVSSIAAYDAGRLMKIGLYEKALDKVGMSVGNGIGSVIANTALIMAVSIIFMPVNVNKGEFFKKAGILILSVVTLWAVTFYTGELRIWGSLILMMIFLLFLWENISSAKKEKSTVEDIPDKDKKSLAKNIFYLIFGAVGIMAGSHLLVNCGGQIASRLGVSDAVIGLTAVAIGTSLPELTTTLAAVVKKQPSLSVGNIIGANIIDIVLILPISSFVYSSALPISRQNALIDFPVCILVTLTALLPALMLKKFRRWQGVVLIIIYSIYIAAVCYMQRVQLQV